MGTVHLHPESSTVADGAVTAAATVERPGGERTRLWYRLPESRAADLSPNLDPFVVGALFTAMSERGDLRAHGRVSPSLLRNLEEFVSTWSHWSPEKYGGIDLIADEEREPALPAGRPAVSAFSGGVDASFTIYRHHRHLAGRRSENVRAGVFVHGFDIPLEEPDTFDSAARKAGLMLDSLGLDLIPMSTNFRELGANWNESHGAAVASALMILQGGFGAGLIGSTEPYRSLVLPWGSNPITDPLLGSDSFRIVHDGASFTRSEKIEVIASWSEATRHLRVCWQGSDKDRNCGTCEKCIRTILNFRLLGLGLPPCFEKDATERDILRLKGLTPVPIAYLQEVLDSAGARGVRAPWTKALERTIARNRRAASGWRRRLREFRNRVALGRRLRGRAKD